MSNITSLLLQIVALFPILLFTYAAFRVVYNLFLHPLRSFPGPLIARSSILYHQRALFNGDSHLHLKKLHEQYGPVVRFAPNELSFIEPSVWKEAYGHRATAFTKDLGFYGSDIYGHPPGLIRSNNVDHARQRKLVSHAFSDKALREQEPILKGYVDILIKKLHEASQKNEGGKVNVVDWYNFLTFDIMADLTFGEPLDLLKGSDYSPWVRALFDNLKLTLITQNIRQWPAIAFILQLLVPSNVKEKRKTHMRFSIDRVEKRLARKTDRPDIMTYILRHVDDEENKGKGLAPTELNSNSSLFMLAGTETTATELSGLTFYLLKNPDKLQRLTKEIRDSFRTYEDLTMTSLGELKYLAACIEEGLRIYPPVAQGLPRKTPEGGARVANFWIPEGTSVQLAPYAAYHSVTNFKNPESFIPERWLPEGQAEYGADRKDALKAFSYGPRNCIGKNLAYNEMRLVLASVLWQFDLELCEESENWIDHGIYILWKKGPLMVKLKNIR